MFDLCLECNHCANHHVSRHVMYVACTREIVIYDAFLHQSLFQVEHILCHES